MFRNQNFVAKQQIDFPVFDIKNVAGFFPDVRESKTFRNLSL